MDGLSKEGGVAFVLLIVWDLVGSTGFLREGGVAFVLLIVWDLVAWIDGLLKEGSRSCICFNCFNCFALLGEAHFGTEFMINVLYKQIESNSQSTQFQDDIVREVKVERQ